MPTLSTEESVNVQIRNVPAELHKRLKAKAAMEGISLSDLLLRELEQLAERKSNAEILRELEAAEPIRLPENLVADMIRTMRGAI